MDKVQGGWKRKVSLGVQFAAAAMITVLFLVWVVFGSATVNRQNATILTGVQAQLAELDTKLETVIAQNTIGDRTIVCILNVDPTKRTEQTTQRCVKAAKAGRDTINVGP